MDQFHSLSNLTNQFVSVAFCRNSEACNGWNRAVVELPIVVLINRYPRH